jgi:apoptosis-inducing factor 2
VVVDEYFALKGAKDMYAIGDVCNVEPLQFIYTDRQSTFLAKNIASILGNKLARPYKVFPVRTYNASLSVNPSSLLCQIN